MTSDKTATANNLLDPASIIPDGVTAYKRTPEFTEQTVPGGLLNAHATKEGVWGRICVIRGELIYNVTDSRRRPRAVLLSPDREGIVEPTILHNVEPKGPVAFFVEFLR